MKLIKIEDVWVNLDYIITIQEQYGVTKIVLSNNEYLEDENRGVDELAEYINSHE